MPLPGVYAFEAIDETLPFLPVAARRALDALGWKMSLEGWLSLSIDDRKRLVRAGLAHEVNADVADVLDRAAPLPTLIEPSLGPDPRHVPPRLRAALGAARPLDEDRWRRLGPLDRYTLVKYEAKQEKLAAAYDEIVPPRFSHLSHLSSTGAAHMVDVGAKTPTARRAIASARVTTTPDVLESIGAGRVAKGDVLAVARVAGIMAAKRVPELIPLCHPVQTTHASIEFEADAVRGELLVRATVEALDRTGVEMEALVAANIAALTVYDMIKSADRWASIDAVRLESKTGGKSGTVTRATHDHAHAHAHAPASAHASAPFVALRDAPLSVDEVIAQVKHSAAGAVCVFLGVVRDHNDGRSVVKLEYEAYPTMAVAEMNRVAAGIAAELPGVRLAVTHRTGALAVGDVAVVCAASAPHRGEAYQACRALIDRVKSRVPIWKREHGPEGAWWVGWEDARCEPGHEH